MRRSLVITGTGSPDAFMQDLGGGEDKGVVHLQRIGSTSHNFKVEMMHAKAAVLFQLVEQILP